MVNSSIIASIGIAPAKYSYQQEDLLNFMHDAYNDIHAKRKLNILFKQSGIKTRHSAIPDFDVKMEEKVLMKKYKTPSIKERLDVFKINALPLAIKAIDITFENIKQVLKINQVTHILTITCTGLYAPGLGSELIEYYKLPVNTFQTGINFMGCNAAFTALRIADSIAAKDEKAIVLIVSVELCTLHFHSKNDNDNLLANTIFSDGAAAAIVTNSSNIDEVSLTVLKVGDISSITLSEGSKLMAWNINPTNFEMVLSGEVPGFISENIETILHQALDISGIDYHDDLIWAVHPGGKKILDLISKIIPEKDMPLKYSYNVLEKFGNMSSATILFVLFMILYEERHYEPIICIGFGPGMSIDTMLLSKATSTEINLNVNPRPNYNPKKHSQGT